MTYEQSEILITDAPDYMTVAEAVGDERNGFPWPISGDATTVLAPMGTP